ncbi:ankyrin repeat-containing protein BDA1-like [Chenopodium quinoa]|uniref:PGG domain-containing protein n=1 Tax=Chenopodium quinoa TaxID=63459 RepID=A0A803LBK6_CHEQI|nr:ankyrin repeat-containing protein BDA1-like [Chenopodium quinoa]
MAGQQAERPHSLATELHDAALNGDVPSLLNLLERDSVVLDQWINDKLAKFMHPPLAANSVTRLLNAALEGDVPSLLSLFQQDPLILDRCIIQNSGLPLHVAAKAGHLEFLSEILRRKPELAEEVDQSKGLSPLHIASTKGHLEIVRLLLAVKPSMCFARDRDGMNPVHVAAVNGQVQVLDELFRAMPEATRERTTGGENVLHLCVKHNQPDALRFLIDVTNDDELLNSRDSDGNTVLHLAVVAKQVEMVTLLLEHKRIDINAVNIKGLTALDSHLLRRRKVKMYYCYHQAVIKWGDDDEIGPSLENSKALRAQDALYIKNKDKTITNQSNALMVAASVIASIAFEVVISPPGGFWQEDSPKGTSYSESHEAGRYIQEKMVAWVYLVVSNTIALASSLSVILLLISGFPNTRLFVVVLRITIWIAVTATVVTYFLSVEISTTAEYECTTFKVPIYTLLAWICLMAIVVLAHAQNFLVKFIIKQPTLRSFFIKWFNPICCVCTTGAIDHV